MFSLYIDILIIYLQLFTYIIQAFEISSIKPIFLNILILNLWFAFGSHNYLGRNYKISKVKTPECYQPCAGFSTTRMRIGWQDCQKDSRLKVTKKEFIQKLFLPHTSERKKEISGILPWFLWRKRFIIIWIFNKSPQRCETNDTKCIFFLKLLDSIFCTDR